MHLFFLFLSVVFAQEVHVYTSPLEVYSNGTRIVNIISPRLPFSMASKHAKLAKVKSLYGWEMIGSSDYLNVWNKDTVSYKYTNCDYKVDPLWCSRVNKHYYVKTFLYLNEEEGLILQELYGKNGQIVSTARISNKKIINWIKQQEITVYEGGFHKPKENLPLKWEIPYRIFSSDFEQVSLRLWSGVKLR